MHTVFDRFIDAVEHATDSDDQRGEVARWLAEYLGKDALLRYGVKPDLFLLADIAEAAWKAGIEEDNDAKKIINEVDKRWRAKSPLSLSAQAKARYLPAVMKEVHGMRPGTAEKVAVTFDD